MSFFTKLPEALYDSHAFDRFKIGAQFDMGTARALAWMSQLAYETDDRDKIKRVLASWGMDFVDTVFAEIKTVLPIAVTHGFVAAGRGATIIAFAGTDPLVLANWITDFDARIDKKTEAAEGFELAATSILPKVETALAKRATHSDRMYVIGHSLGGALAALIAWRLSQTTAVEGVYTIGMPRTCSREFAPQYDGKLGDRTYRLVHGEDVVPSVAPAAMGLRHVGRYLHCARQGTFVAGDLAAVGTTDDPQFARGISREFTDFVHRPWGGAVHAAKSLALAARLLVGLGPQGVRSDIGGIAIELLPQRLRDHMPDRYIAACRP